MNYVYSAENNLFYPVQLQHQYEKNGDWPSDAIGVDDSVFYDFTSYREGKTRVSGPDGLPLWGDIHQPGHEELIQIADNERQRLLSNADSIMLDWRTELMLGEISDANKAKLSAWLAYKNEVKVVDVTTDPEHVNWPVPPEV
ncbi:MAG: tail fiber assembly protein [Citrobacter sp.]|nr:tail fiber assembly protein [Citrobacter sp.]